MSELIPSDSAISDVEGDSASLQGEKKSTLSMTDLFDLDDVLFEIGKHISILSWDQLTRTVKMHYDVKGKGGVLPRFHAVHVAVYEHHLTHDFRSSLSPSRPDEGVHESMSGYFSRLFVYLKTRVPFYDFTLDCCRMAYQAARIMASIITCIVLRIMKELPYGCITRMPFLKYRFCPKRWQDKEQQLMPNTSKTASNLRISLMFPDCSPRRPRTLGSTFHPVHVPQDHPSLFIPDLESTGDVTEEEEMASKLVLLQAIFTGLPDEIETTSRSLASESDVTQSVYDTKLKWYFEVGIPRMKLDMADKITYQVDPTLRTTAYSIPPLPHIFFKPSYVSYNTFASEKRKEKTAIVYDRACGPIMDIFASYNPFVVKLFYAKDPFLGDSQIELDETLAAVGAGIPSAEEEEEAKRAALRSQILVDHPELKEQTPLFSISAHREDGIFTESYVRKQQIVCGYGDALKTNSGPEQTGVRYLLTENGEALYFIKEFDFVIRDLDAVSILRFACELRGDPTEWHWADRIYAFASTTKAPTTLLARLACELHDSGVQGYSNMRDRDKTTDRTLSTVFHALCTHIGRPLLAKDLEETSKSTRFIGRYQGMTEKDMVALQRRSRQVTYEFAYEPFLALLKSSKARDRLMGVRNISAFDYDDIMAANRNKRWRFMEGSEGEDTSEETKRGWGWGMY